MTQYATIEALCNGLAAYGNLDSAYVDRMMHKIPSVPIVNRSEWVPARCANKTVLSLGHSGHIAKLVEQKAYRVYGVDIDGHAEFQIDLDDDPQRDLPDVCVELVLCGEVLEHLGNPQRLLKALRRYEVPVIITVPNAFGRVGTSHIKKGVENVNSEHVAYYSYCTLLELTRRCGYEVVEWFWSDNHGSPAMFTEGLIFVVR